jgi:hypothetical protein
VRLRRPCIGGRMYFFYATEGNALEYDKELISMKRIYDYTNNDGYEVATLLNAIDADQKVRWQAMRKRRHKKMMARIRRQDKNILKAVLLINGGFLLYCIAKVTYKALTMGL